MALLRKIMQISVVCFILPFVLATERATSPQQVTWTSLHPITELFGILSCNLPPEPSLSGEEQNLYFPWTQKPVCSGAFTNDSQILCIFSDSRFNDGRGISIITTREIALLLPQSPLYAREGLAPDYIKGTTISTSSSGRGLELTEFEDRVPMYRTVKPGEEIVANKGVLMMHPAFYDLSWAEREELLRIAVSRLPRQTQQAVLRLDDSPAQINLLLAHLVRSHSGFYAVVGRKRHSLLLPEIGLINHSCAPNSYMRMDADSFTQRVVAARFMRRGEEITVSYNIESDVVSHLKPTAERQAILQEKFNFHCNCAQCRKGDAGDREIAKVHAATRQLQSKREFTEDDLKDALYLNEMYRAAGLEVVQSVPAKAIRRVYSFLRDGNAASHWQEEADRIQRLNNQLVAQSQSRGAYC